MPHAQPPLHLAHERKMERVYNHITKKLQALLSILDTLYRVTLETSPQNTIY